MRRVMGSQVNKLWLPAAASMGMATHTVNMDTDSTHRRSMTGPYSRGKERPGGDVWLGRETEPGLHLARSTGKGIHKA